MRNNSNEAEIWWTSISFLIKSDDAVLLTHAGPSSLNKAPQRMPSGMEVVVPTSQPRWNHFLHLHHSWWSELIPQSGTPCPESCHRTPDWGTVQPAEYCPALWLPVCSSVSHDWPHWPSHPAATPQPKHPVKPQGRAGCQHMLALMGKKTADRLA